MLPSGEQLLRPILAFATLCLAAFLLAPTVASVHERVEALGIDRELPWQIWKWTDEPLPNIIPGCGKSNRHLYSEVTQWPDRIEKDEAFTLRGVVQSEEDGRMGVATVKVDLFLNETKSEPGVLLGQAESGAGGFFTLNALIPHELPATRYHIVAHAKTTTIDCTVYLEHWSDPETDVVSDTKIVWDPVDNAVAGRAFTIHGRLVDAVDVPLGNQSLSVSIDGRRSLVKTDVKGEFSIERRPEKAENITFNASYKGGRYYRSSSNETIVPVQEEIVEISPSTFNLTRGTPITVTGNVYVAASKRSPEMTFRFHGLDLAGCDGCAASNEIAVTIGPDGAFSTTLLAPSSIEPGRGNLTLSGGGLRGKYSYPVHVSVPTTLQVEVDRPSFFGRHYAGEATLVDETGSPVASTLSWTMDGSTIANATDTNGTLAFGGDAACGRYVGRADHAGTDLYQPTSASGPVLVCGWLAFVPAWVLATPWWVWPAGLAAVALAIYVARSWRQRYAPVILGGPPLTLEFSEPDDEARGYAGVGETVTASAYLTSPLPDEHKLRMGIGRDVDVQPLDAGLRAHLRLTPDKLGEIRVRAEIVDARGRVVARRTLTLRVIRYAEEIEERYLRLRAATGATDSVTPREFEAWLHARADGLDPDVVRRLVRIFEEADYSPRTAQRGDLAAYLRAEGGVQEVSAAVAR